MPRVIARVLHAKYGFQYYPIFQRLTNGMEVYPAEVFPLRLPMVLLSSILPILVLILGDFAETLAEIKSENCWRNCIC